MPGYRRFIAYIYDYLNGRKGNNCGYVKVELRGGACRMMLHVQPYRNKNEPAQVFGFVRGAGNILAIPMGTAAQRGNAWEYQISTPETDFAGSGRVAAEIRGLWMKCGGEDYISVWDEEPVTPQMFALLSADRTAELQPEEGKGTGEQPAEEDRLQDEAGRVQAAGREAPESSREGAAQGEKNAEALDAAHIESLSAQEQKPDQAENTSDVDPTPDLPAPAAAKTTAASLAARWEHFRRHYPELSPFLDGEIAQAFSITLKDLVFLGEPERPYCTSPFVQQAFLHYHHLLLGRFENGGFLLGVPGECRGAQDRHLARMYGFPYYKEAAAPEGKGPAPAGYWYHIL